MHFQNELAYLFFLQKDVLRSESVKAMHSLYYNDSNENAQAAVCSSAFSWTLLPKFSYS